MEDCIVILNILLLSKKYQVLYLQNENITEEGKSILSFYCIFW